MRHLLIVSSAFCLVDDTTTEVIVDCHSPELRLVLDNRSKWEKENGEIEVKQERQKLFHSLLVLDDCKYQYIIILRICLKILEGLEVDLALI